MWNLVVNDCGHLYPAFCLAHHAQWMLAQKCQACLLPLVAVAALSAGHALCAPTSSLHRWHAPSFKHQQSRLKCWQPCRVSCHDWALNGKTTITWLSIEICVRFDVGSPTSGRSPLTEVRPLSAQRTAHTQDKVEPSQDLTWLQGVHYAHFALATRRPNFGGFATDALWCFLTCRSPTRGLRPLHNCMLCRMQPAVAETKKPTEANQGGQALDRASAETN